MQRFSQFLEQWSQQLPVLKTLQNNLYLVSGLGHVGLYFSYQTLIGYRYQDRVFVCATQPNGAPWTQTTNRHINSISGERINGPAFLESYKRDIGNKTNNNLPSLLTYGKGINSKQLFFSPNCILYFSYETLVGFYDGIHLMIRENDWRNPETGRLSRTTPKHLNAIFPDKEKHLDAEAFARAVHDLFTGNLL